MLKLQGLMQSANKHQQKINLPRVLLLPALDNDLLLRLNDWWLRLSERNNNYLHRNINIPMNNTI